MGKGACVLTGDLEQVAGAETLAALQLTLVQQQPKRMAVMKLPFPQRHSQGPNLHLACMDPPYLPTLESRSRN